MKPSVEQLDDKAVALLPVSVTLLGLLKAFEGLKGIELFMDEMLAVASVFFLGTLLLTRYASGQSKHDLPAGLAQVSYDLGLVTLMVAAILLAIGRF